MLLVANNMEDEITKKIDDRIKKLVPEILKGSGFTDRKITDTPTDSLAVVNRKYVQLSGTVATRPIGSVATMGQSYFATDTNFRMTYNANSSVWVSGGSIVAQG